MGAIQTLKPIKLDYKNARCFMQTGDLLSWRSDTLLGAGIRLFTRGHVNHSSIVADINEYGKSRKFCLEALEGGIELHCISRRLKNFKGKVYWHKLRNEYKDYRTEIGTAAFSRIGIDYDYGSLFRQLVGRVSLNAKKLFCSEFVYLNFVDAKVPGAFKDAIAPNPQELFSSHLFWGQPVLIKE